MLLIDRRIGSKDLPALLTPLGVRSELTTLQFGDVALVGRGPKDTPVPVGVELKTVGDLLNSMTTGRLSGHQLPGLLATYQQVWLLVEGSYRPNPENGLLEVWRGGWRALHLGTRSFMYRELEAYLLTLAIKGGVYVTRTGSRQETARWLAALYHWWSDKAFDEHRSHTATHRKAAFVARAADKPSLGQRIAAELPGIGIERSAAIAAAFPTVRALVDADEAAWQEIPGIGKKLAAAIVAALNN